MPPLGPNNQALQQPMAQTKHDYIDFYTKCLEHRETIASRKCPSGQVIDWISIESQGEIATPPPPLEPTIRNQAHEDSMPTGSQPVSELEANEHLHGPQGTVPILRPSLVRIDFDKPIKWILSKTGPPDASGRIAISSTDRAKHWYASSAQNVMNYGCQGKFSMYNPFVETNEDFSLIQLAEIHNNGAYDPSHPRVDNRQTVEAGLIRFPSKFGDDLFHFFTFFTTVGYERYGDYVQSWNLDYKGWVQVDRTIHPGSVFSTLSTENGPQYDLWLSYRLYNGNWWLWVKDRWIGYYPASMFGTGNTLADHADRTSFYGEIFDSTEVTGITTSDMGSGNFPETGWEHSAYIYLIGYQPQPSSTSTDSVDYDGSRDIYIDDPARYRIEPHFKSGTNWRSYAWLGGPGAGGVIGH